MRVTLGPNDQPTVLRCSFCSKAQAEVQKLIAGPHVFICDECVAICVDIIASESVVAPLPRTVVPPDTEAPAVASPVVTCGLCGLQTTRTTALAVPDRGFLCSGCCGAIEASLAERRALARWRRSR